MARKSSNSNVECGKIFCYKQLKCASSTLSEEPGEVLARNLLLYMRDKRTDCFEYPPFKNNSEPERKIHCLSKELCVVTNGTKMSTSNETCKQKPRKLSLQYLN